MAQTVSVIVGAEDRAPLAAVVDDRKRLQKHVQRARIVLLSAERLPLLAVALQDRDQPACGVALAAAVRRSRGDGLLRDKTRKPGKPRLSAETVAKVLAFAVHGGARGGNPLDRPRRRRAAGISLRGAAELGGAPIAAAGYVSFFVCPLCAVKSVSWLSGISALIPEKGRRRRGQTGSLPRPFDSSSPATPAFWMAEESSLMAGSSVGKLRAS